MSAVGRKSGSLFLFVFLTFNVCAATPAQFYAAQSSPAPPLASADAAMQAGRFDEAARAYEAWLKARPEAKEVMLALAVCYVQLGRHAEAEAVLRRYLKLAPASAAARAALGVALLDGARNEEAKAELERAVRLNPKQRDAAEALARIYLVEGRAAEAAALLRPLAEAGGEGALELLADALVKGGRPRAAAEMLGRELQADPRGTPGLYAAAGWAHLKAGDLASAAEVCERGMRLYPDSEIEAVYLSLPAPFLAERVGARIERLQQGTDAAELIALGRVLTDADPARKTRAGEIAQKLLAHAVELAPDSASARYNYGRALAPDSPARALAEWEKALALKPGDDLRLQILIKVAAARLDLSDFRKAEGAFREALEINRRLPRRRPEAALEYVRFLQLRSRTDEAETLLDEVVRWNPLSPQARLERAKLLAARGSWEKVVEEGEFVLRGAGDDVETLRSAHLLLARAYLRLNRPEDARRHQEWISSH
jgi:tetratricopeptide (TPR) repeat protein